VPGAIRFALPAQQFLFSHPMKIVTYNVNGIRSAMSKGLLPWLAGVDADVVCLQEIKAGPEQVAVGEIEALGYNHYWHPAQKKGYSGVAIFSRVKPTSVEYGCGIRTYDDEGRVLRADFGDISVMSVYHPSGSSGDERQAFKMKWLGDFHSYAAELKKSRPGLVLSGDFNICHRPIDIHNPVSNARSSGFLPEEREWMEQFINSGFIDTFRHFNPDPHHYTWWSYRSGARKKNLGWRIDYHLASRELALRLKHAGILPDAVHSDHCPVVLELV
jgi:exodeoxyribonuclease III